LSSVHASRAFAFVLPTPVTMRPSEILVAVRVGVSLGVRVIVGVPREVVLVPVLCRPVHRAAAAEIRVLPLRLGDVQGVRLGLLIEGLGVPVRNVSPAANEHDGAGQTGKLPTSS